MRFFSIQPFRRKAAADTQGGFTIMELLVTMAVSMVLLGGCVSAYVFLTLTYKKHKEVTRIHRKLRGPVSIVSWETTMTGRSGLQPRSSKDYGVTKITKMDLLGADDPAGYPALVVTTLIEDRDGNGRIDDKDNPPYTITYRLYDFDGDTAVQPLFQPDFGKFVNDGAGNITITLIARNVVNIGFAFATDSDRDGELDPINGATQWSVSVGNPAGELNFQLDANGDGLVDANDDTNGDGSIDGGDGAMTALGSSIPLNRIRQAKIYLLVRSNTRDPRYFNRNRYQVGQQVIRYVPGDPLFNYRHQVLSIGISLRNREDELQI